MKTFTAQFMKDNCGCYSQDELSACSFMRNSAITLDEILNSEIKLKDKYWFVCKKILTKEQNQQLSIGVAEVVLEIFEKKYPDDKRPRKAIQAAKDYLAGTIDRDTLIEARRAAADAAAYAAYAAAAAAAAAYAYAAYAYAYAAYAYAYAAYAAAADDGKFKTALLVYLKEFVKGL